jgi:hypothetical protein
MSNGDTIRGGHYKAARKICREKKVRVYFSSSLIDASGEANVETQAITISKPNCDTVNKFFSALFHELTHIWCVRNGKYPMYHTTKQRLTEQEKNGLILTALRAERYVEKMAKIEMKKYFPKLKYVTTYQTEADRIWLHTTYLYMFKKKK